MAELIFHAIVGIVSVILCLINLFFIYKIFKKSSNGFRKAYSLMALVILLLLALAIILLLDDFKMFAFQLHTANIILDLLVAFALLLLALATYKISYIIDFMPKGILEKLNEYL